jgi:hypothetical protein
LKRFILDLVVKKAIFAVPLAIFLVVASASYISADGMIIPPRPSQQIYETDQKAVIWYEDGKETLILSTTFKGDVNEFVWVIPTPNDPEVGKSKDELFTSLDEYTKPPQPSYDRMPLMGTGSLDLSVESPSPKVVVHETKRVDIYDTAVLEANDADALRNWLNQHNYDYPENKRHLLDYYIEKNWYFVAAKIDTQALGYAGSALKEGHATPLLVTFDSPTIIYPLRISGSPAEEVQTEKIAAYSFETGTQGWPSSSSITTQTRSVDTPVTNYPRTTTDESYHGRYSLLLTNGSQTYSTASSPPSLEAKLVTGKNYVFSGYIKVKESSSAVIHISATNTADETMVVNDLEQFGEWKRFEYPFTYRSGSRLLINVQSANGELIYIDALQVDEGVEATSFTTEFLPGTSIQTRQTDSPVNIVLYVFADKKQDLPGFTTEFADHVNARSIEKFSINEKGEPWIDTRGRKYLTKLSQTMKPSEMVDDLVVREADNQKDVNGRFTGLPWWSSIVIFIFVAVEVVVAGYFWWRYSKRKA